MNVIVMADMTAFNLHTEIWWNVESIDLMEKDSFLPSNSNESYYQLIEI